jgi:hypothetical protein
MQLRLAYFRAVSGSDRAATVRKPFKLLAVPRYHLDSSVDIAKESRYATSDG